MDTIAERSKGEVTALPRDRSSDRGAFYPVSKDVVRDAPLIVGAQRCSGLAADQSLLDHDRDGRYYAVVSKRPMRGPTVDMDLRGRLAAIDRGHGETGLQYVTIWRLRR